MARHVRSNLNHRKLCTLEQLSLSVHIVCILLDCVLINDQQSFVINQLLRSRPYILDYMLFNYFNSFYNIDYFISWFYSCLWQSSSYMDCTISSCIFFWRKASKNSCVTSPLLEHCCGYTCHWQTAPSLQVIENFSTHLIFSLAHIPVQLSVYSWCFWIKFVICTILQFGCFRFSWKIFIVVDYDILSWFSISCFSWLMSVKF